MGKILDNWIEFIIFFLCLIPIVITDIKEKRIPDIYILACFIAIFISKLILGRNLSLRMVFNIATGFAFIWMVWFITKGKIGLGDAKLSALIAFFLGIPGWLLAIFIAALSGSIYGLIKIRSNKMKREDAIPFAPFMALGSISSFFLGDHLVRMYYGFGS